MQTRPPQWLVNALRGILERVDPLPAELARWRDLAPDTPDYVRAEMETAVEDVQKRPGGLDCGVDLRTGQGVCFCGRCSTANRGVNDANT
jgi:hypothetical protein